MIERTFFFVNTDYPKVLRPCVSAEDRNQAKQQAKQVAIYEAGHSRVVFYFDYKLPHHIAIRYAEMGYEIVLGLGTLEGLTSPKYFEKGAQE